MAWKASVDGAVYAQPVIVGTTAYIVTEDNDVYALDLADGRILWRASVGAPLTDVAAAAGCGDIDPLGITSTPVVDSATGTLYVVAEVSDGGSPPSVHRQLVGLDVTDGHVVSSMGADPTGGGDSQINLLQRAGLVLDGGRVDVSYGGQYGDCGYYHGWVVAVSVTPGVSSTEFDTTSGGSGGAIWQGGAPPSLDGAGNLFVGTGNQNAQGTAGDYESVVKLSPSLAAEATFRDSRATGDEDFGTGNPVLVPDGTVFAVGKTDIGYVLRQSDLSLVATVSGVCGSDPDGREVFDPATDAVYVPCRGGGIQEVDLATNTLGWRSGAVNSSPVLAAGKLWALAYPTGTLQELDPATGSIEQSVSTGPVATFATPVVAGALVVVATSTGEVEAFGRP